MNKNFAMSYSGGKDSILALYTLIQDGYIPKVLFTVNRDFTESKNFHALSKDILNRVSESLQIAIEYFDLGATDIYQEKYPEFLSILKKKYDLEFCAFGDIFLENMRCSRIADCEKVGLHPLLPIFGSKEEDIFNKFIDSGFKGFIKSIDTRRVCPCLIGEEIDKDLVALIKGFDISLCGEKGEYHTFVYDGPIFSEPVSYQLGDPILLENYLTLEIS